MHILNNCVNRIFKQRLMRQGRHWRRKHSMINIGVSTKMSWKGRELRTNTELAKARAEAEGRIRQERENHDLIMDKVRLEAAESRDTVLKAVADGGKMLGEGLSSYLTDGEKLRNTAFMVSLAAVGIYSAKTAAGIAGRFIEVSLFIYQHFYLYMLQAIFCKY